MCALCNIWVCVSVGFVMCGFCKVCVFVFIVICVFECMGFVM